jgi:hypothetical protein
MCSIEAELTVPQLLPHVCAPRVRNGRFLRFCGTSTFQRPQEALSFPL